MDNTLSRKVSTGFRMLLQITPFRNLVTVVRAIYLVRVRRAYRELEHTTSGVAENALFHNRRAMIARGSGPRSGKARSGVRYVLGVGLGENGARSHRLLRPLTAIWDVEKNIRRMRVLAIGPRGEGELFNIMSYGFRWENIRGVDLFSYSPRIDLGDIHALPYPDDSFDIVLCGWVLAYSEDRARACQEMSRVVRPGGYIAIGSTFLNRSVEEMEREAGYRSGAREKIRSNADILPLFGERVGATYFNHDRQETDTDPKSSLLAVFSVAK